MTSSEVKHESLFSFFAKNGVYQNIRADFGPCQTLRLKWQVAMIGSRYNVYRIIIYICKQNQAQYTNKPYRTSTTHAVFTPCNHKLNAHIVDL